MITMELALKRFAVFSRIVLELTKYKYKRKKEKQWELMNSLREGFSMAG